MQTREIPHGEWQLFFDDFGQRHRGMHVNVETIAEGDVRSELRDAPLVGIVVAKPKTGGEDWIEVIAGDSPDACATHAIPKPAHMWLAEEENGRAVALQIESTDGWATMIRFEPPREGLPPGFMLC